MPVVHAVKANRRSELKILLSLAAPACSLCDISHRRCVSNFGRVCLMSTAGHRITQSLRKQAYAAILQQETAMFDRESTGELVGRLSDTQLISSAVTSNVSDDLRSAIMAITRMSMMFYVAVASIISINESNLVHKGVSEIDFFLGAVNERSSALSLYISCCDTIRCKTYSQSVIYIVMITCNKNKSD
ncbi:ATP-binding cassette sub-family B member 10, mitochondrial-like isoform X2 [Temnothorax curvispinosus]|uniref:ATP-binding cassette sub-family B member 10, mitochondrial-like isoform X2 n=1 Tax=Temnothorax curvispinosus TaxID=300111 RepID=A0A6J1RER9_9HYME|nr:ATP-binding cassette sub-family B member 10, mitochondrial-like isoform X2 [Temnothorax curvispinosus]